MSKPVATDAKGIPLYIGAFVVYTTNSRGSGLSFGTIATIKEKVVTRYNYDRATQQRVPYQDLDFKIVVEATDAHGNPKFLQEYDSVSQTSVDTAKRSRSGQIDHYPSKFLIL